MDTRKLPNTDTQRKGATGWIVILGLAVAAIFGAAVLSAQVMAQYPGNETVVVTAFPLPTQVAPRPRDIAYAVEADIASLKREGLNVHLPESVPDGFTRVKLAQVINPLSQGQLLSEIWYEGVGGAYFVVGQQLLTTPSRVVVMDNTVLRKADINGSLGIAYDPGGPLDRLPERRAMLVWTAGQYKFSITGSVGIDRMFEITRSLKPQ